MSCPLAMLKFAQEGLFCTENDSDIPEGPLAVGWKVYGVPATALVGGVPEIVGGGGGGALTVAASTCTVNAGRLALWSPSLTEITMLA